MDGVIADTEPLHEQARNILLADLGLDVESISPAAKPAPDVYLRALALCGVSAGEALAVEDSDTGAKAAAAAGIACVAYDVVETDNWKQTFDVCRYKVKRMEDIERIVLNGNGRYAAI